MIKAKNDHKVLDAAHLFCPSSRSGARVKLGGIRLPQHGFSAPRLEPMFWHLLPALVNFWSSVQAALSAHENGLTRSFFFDEKRDRLGRMMQTELVA